MLARPEPAPLRVNVGCGATPTPGWANLDNSPSVRLGALPWLWPFLPANQRSFARAARDGGIRHGVATDLPFASSSVDVLYSSHMMEHLDRAEVTRFLAEALRVLRPGGTIRLVLPDIRRLVDQYQDHGDADLFISKSCMGQDRPTTLLGRLKLAIQGPRHHLWMYDGPSLSRRLSEAGFARPVVLPIGKTTIPDPGPLDLHEREAISVYVEAVRP